MNSQRTIRIIGVILLLWGLMGIAAFVMQYRIDPVELARTDPTTARAFASMPAWLWVVYAFAVGTGFAGSLALIAQRKSAVPLYAISLIAVLIQFGYTLGATPLIAEKGIAAAAGFPVLIILVALFQLFYSRMLAAKSLLR